MPTLNQRIVTPQDASHPELGRWLWALEDTRGRTKRSLDGITQNELDWLAPGVENAIGSLLYHIALIEADYLYADILGVDYPGWLEKVLPFPDRDGQGRLSVVTGVTLVDHLDRLDRIRSEFVRLVSPLTAAQIATARPLPEFGYEISPEWTLHLLMQHEAEHRGQIGQIRELCRALAQAT